MLEIGILIMLIILIINNNNNNVMGLFVQNIYIYIYIDTLE